MGERRYRQKRGHPKWILRPKRSRNFRHCSCRGPLLFNWAAPCVASEAGATSPAERTTSKRSRLLGVADIASGRVVAYSAICPHCCEALLRCGFTCWRPGCESSACSSDSLVRVCWSLLWTPASSSLGISTRGIETQALGNRIECVVTAPTRRMKQKSTESNMTYGSEPCFGFRMAFPGGTREFQNLRNLV